MKKSVPILLLVVFLLQLAQLPVLALDVIVRENGTIYMYQDQVLGDDDQEDETVVEVEKEFEDEQEREQTQVRNVESVEKKYEELRRQKIKAEQLANPTKVVPRTQQKSLRVTTKQDGVEVKLEEKNRLKDRTENTLRKSETIEDKRLRIEVPVAENEVENEVEGEDDATVPLEIQRVREEKQARKEEKLEIQSETHDDGSVEFQFESRDVKAKLKGAQFTIDPETNLVTLTTPGGNVHVLNHLPDQAIQNMIRAGVIRTAPVVPSPTSATESADSADDTTQEATGSATESALLESEVEIEAKEDGTVVYATTVKKPKKLLGLFRRGVLTRVELDDSTGEISESEVESTNPLVRFLNALSF